MCIITCFNSKEVYIEVTHDKDGFISIRKALFTALESEEDYIEAPNLLFKINLHFT